MIWWQAEFDKLLIAAFILILCAMSLLGNDKLTSFAIVAASNFTGCLLTLVVAKRGHPPDADPTSSATATASTTTSTTEAQTVTPSA